MYVKKFSLKTSWESTMRSRTCQDGRKQTVCNLIQARQPASYIIVNVSDPLTTFPRWSAVSSSSAVSDSSVSLISITIFVGTATWPLWRENVLNVRTFCAEWNLSQVMKFFTKFTVHWSALWWITRARSSSACLWRIPSAWTWSNVGVKAEKEFNLTRSGFEKIECLWRLISFTNWMCPHCYQRPPSNLSTQRSVSGSFLLNCIATSWLLFSDHVNSCCIHFYRLVSSFLNLIINLWNRVYSLWFYFVIYSVIYFVIYSFDSHWFENMHLSLSVLWMNEIVITSAK